MIACRNSVLRAGGGAARKYQPAWVISTSSFGVSTRSSISAALTMAIVSPNSLPIRALKSNTLMVSCASSMISQQADDGFHRHVRNRLDARAAGRGAPVRRLPARSAACSGPGPPAGAARFGRLVGQDQRGDRGMDLVDHGGERLAN